MSRSRAERQVARAPSASAAAVWVAPSLVVAVHLAATTVPDETVSTIPLMAVEAALLAVVAAVEVASERASVRDGAVLCGCWVALVGAAVLGATVTAPSVVALWTGVALALAGFGLHRFELVSLGLVEVDDGSQ